ncbi:hypothetical protein FRX31_004650 [Thalictrum thalictroides]|uniref:Uncharacterized protein n=1 Tax=Thalictrum thalictroides TaxID=46969 RepID=A0A7J6X8L7_THATH|nr:hypothetical protein FRX31_004650 [Thalictrum thalictroides]
MASTLSDENLMSSYSSNYLEFESMEMSEIDEDLMMALLEESHVEEDEDERLGSVIRSLEAEIDHRPESSQSTVGMSEDTHDCFGYSASNICDSFDWIDDMEMASTSYDDLGKWYAYSIDNETVDQMIEYRNNIDNFELSQTFADSMEHFSLLYHADEHMYSSSLWQETYDPVPVMYQ